MKVGESDVPQYVITALDKGSHVIGIQAVYQNGMSAITEYVIEDMTAIRTIGTTTEDADGHLTDLLGRRVVMPKHGIYLWNGKKVIR